MLDAVNDAKQRTEAARMEGDVKAYRLAGEELLYLECCLVTEVQLLVDSELGILPAA